MNRFISKVLMGGVAATLALGAGMGAATASNYPGTNPNRNPTCTSGHACIWRDFDYETNGSQSSRIGFENSIEDLSKYTYGGGASSQTGYKTGSSFHNNGRTSTACFYTDLKFAGETKCINKGGVINSVSWNDNTASARYI